MTSVRLPAAAGRAALVLLPAAAMLLAAPFAGGGAAGRFQVGVLGLVVTAGLWAFAIERTPRVVGLLVLGVPLATLAHLVLGGGADTLLATAACLLGTGAAAGGLALLGRRTGAPRVAAGVLATAVPVAAMLGLFWADPLGDRLPPAKRFAFKQAVVHLDTATAFAYDGATFDRFHDERIYRDVALTSGAVRPPQGVPTGLAWLALGLLAGTAAWVLPRGAERPA